MKKRVMVTGSNGLLGQKLIDLYLRKSDVEFFASSRGENRHPIKQNYHYHSLDITDEKELKAVIRDIRPDTIIHTAALTQVDQCESERDLCDLLNVEAVRWICDSAEIHGSHLIHLSTDFIFDGEKGPYSEDDEANPLSYYGESKLKAEKVVMASKTNWAIARTILVYGLVAEMSRSNIVLWAIDALKQQKDIQVVDDQFRMPTLAEDLAKGCELIESKRAEGIFHLSGKDYMSVYDLVQEVARASGLSAEKVSRANSKSFTQPAKRPPKTGFVLDKAMAVLNYRPHSFHEGVKLVLEQLGGIE
jgi:dTDP-4-dehydrorhamnose reductase